MAIQHSIFSGPSDGVHLVRRCPGNSEGDTRVDVGDIGFEVDVIGGYVAFDDVRRAICGTDKRVDVEVDVDVIRAYMEFDDVRRAIFDER